MTSELLGLLPAEIERLNGILARSESSNDREVLALDASAGVREIKRAYFEIAALVHPDRFFGRDIGPLKAKLEKAYLRATRAHDALLSGANAPVSTPVASVVQASGNVPVERAAAAPALSLADRRALLARKLGGARPAPVAPEAESSQRATSTPPALTEADFQALIARARQSAGDNNWGQAFAYVQAAAPFGDAEPADLVWCAEVAIRAKITNSFAIDVATRAVSLSPSMPSAHVMLAKAYEAVGRLDMASRAAESGTRLCAGQSEIVELASTLKKRAAAARR